MVVFSKIHTIFPDNYALVVFTGVGSGVMNAWLMSRVMRARKEHKVEYPKLYSEDNNEFNCIQRAHQNYLENQPQFLMILFLGGLQYPKISAAAGALYLASRVAYATGYSSGDPRKRNRGDIGYVGYMVLLGSAIRFAYSLANHQCLNPGKRRRGAFGYIGILTLLGNTISFAYHLGKHSGFFTHNCC